MDRTAAGSYQSCSFGTQLDTDTGNGEANYRSRDVLAFRIRFVRQHLVAVVEPHSGMAARWRTDSARSGFVGWWFDRFEFEGVLSGCCCGRWLLHLGRTIFCGRVVYQPCCEQLSTVDDGRSLEDVEKKVEKKLKTRGVNVEKMLLIRPHFVQYAAVLSKIVLISLIFS